MVNDYNYFGARYYDPNISIWLSVDPLSDEAPGWTPYRYAFNNPIGVIDPNGLFEDIVITGENNSSVTVKTDLIDIEVDASSLVGDLGGNYTLEGNDVLIAALDVAGVVDPTGVADIAAATLEAESGNWGGAVLSGLGVIPYVGDLGKLGKVGKHVKTIRKAISKNPGLGNQFKGKTTSQVNKAMEKHVSSGKLERKYVDPVSGSTSYKNTKSGYSYNVDSGKSGRTGQKVEPAHIDVNYPNPKPRTVPSKKKLPIKN